MRRGLACLLLFLFSTSLVAEAATAKKSSAYVFADQLAKAQATNLYPHNKEEEGVWKKDSLQFPSASTGKEIKIRVLTFNGQTQKGIYFQPIEAAVRRLRFFKVTPGSKMVIYYGVDDKAAAEPPTANLYLKIYLGQHELRRIQIPNDKGWKRQEIDLGIASFLKKGVVVTFELATDSPGPLPFGFWPEISR